MNEPPVQQLSARTVYRNRWMTVSEHRVRRSDATEGIYGLVDKPDFALIIPVEGDGFHLVTQYRYPTREHSLEFPQGTSESETFAPDELAQAELIEELGLRAGHIEHLGAISPAPGTSSQRCNVFVATQLEPDTSREPDPEEHDLRHQWLTRDAFEFELRCGRITDGATIAAYTLWLLNDHRPRRQRPAHARPARGPEGEQPV